MRNLDKIVKQAQEIGDVNIMDRIEAVSKEVEAQTTTVMKHTEAVDRLIKSSPEIEAKDKEALEGSNRYDFKNKDEDGKPTKVLPSGRPVFTSFYERFVWDLENKMVDDSTKKLAVKYPKMWDMAQSEHERKIG